MCYSVMHCVAVCCRALQCVACIAAAVCAADKTHACVNKCVAVCVAVCCSELQCDALCIHNSTHPWAFTCVDIILFLTYGY